MRSKIHLLESNLTKHLNTQVYRFSPPFARYLMPYPKKTKPVSVPVPVFNDQSMVNPASWMSSELSSSPSQALGEDSQVSMMYLHFRHADDQHGIELPNVDTTVSAKPTPVPTRGRVIAPKPVTPPSHVTPPKALPASTSVSHNAPFTYAKKTSDKPHFGRLATDCSDEILDFDDEQMTRKGSPLSSLGKRSGSGTPPKPAEERSATKPIKRLVGGICDCYYSTH